MSGTPKKIINQLDPISFYSKIGSGSFAAVRRAVSNFLPFLASQSSAPSLNANVVKLHECEEECDEKRREAKFAFRSTDLGSWASSSRGGINTDTDPKNIQHWALVVHFPRGKKTYLFEAWKDESNGLLQPGRAEGVDYEVFEKATYFGTTETSPSELLTKAKQVSTKKRSPCYNAFFNNSQTWLREFLHLISPKLLLALYKEVPATEICCGLCYNKTYLSYLAGSHVV